MFRNTYKPLLAETIVEFWNRYYYYFKELLVNFFFFPVFTRYFKQSPRLRMAAAVFAAAFFGNMYYHVITSTRSCAATGPGCGMQFNPRLLYCLVLALGIYHLHAARTAAGKGGPPRSLAAPRAGHLRGVDFLCLHPSVGQGQHDPRRSGFTLCLDFSASAEIVPPASSCLSNSMLET